MTNEHKIVLVLISMTPVLLVIGSILPNLEIAIDKTAGQLVFGYTIGWSVGFMVASMVKEKG